MQFEMEREQGGMEHGFTMKRDGNGFVPAISPMQLIQAAATMVAETLDWVDQRTDAWVPAEGDFHVNPAVGITLRKQDGTEHPLEDSLGDARVTGIIYDESTMMYFIVVTDE